MILLPSRIVHESVKLFMGSNAFLEKFVVQDEVSDHSRWSDAELEEDYVQLRRSEFRVIEGGKK